MKRKIVKIGSNQFDKKNLIQAISLIFQNWHYSS